jgi:hypothetical protein
LLLLRLLFSLLKRSCSIYFFRCCNCCC